MTGFHGYYASQDTVDGEEHEVAVEIPDFAPSLSGVIYISGDKQEVIYKHGYFSLYLYCWITGILFMYLALIVVLVACYVGDR